jgi:D-glycero-alpha-D-manno-heptose-7-phosphate kinase
MSVTREGSVRVDLLGGTIDLPPIHLVLENVVTLNVATSLKARATVSSTKKSGVTLSSLDYKKKIHLSKRDILSGEAAKKHKGLAFVIHLIASAGVSDRAMIEISSNAPAGSGLGGSSAMGVTLYAALMDFLKIRKTREEIIRIVNALEGKILNAGMPGYQDYYPALFGGVLGLVAKPDHIEVRQLFSRDLKDFLERHLTLVYSGQTRHSGINNWEVYKAFFDGNKSVRAGLAEIARLSCEAYKLIESGKFKNSKLLNLISREGLVREKLFPAIVTKDMKKLLQTLKRKTKRIGLKVCGAGGGGCFILIHESCDREMIESAVLTAKMRVLPFDILPPLVP